MHYQITLTVSTDEDIDPARIEALLQDAMEDVLRSDEIKFTSCSYGAMTTDIPIIGGEK